MIADRDDRRRPLAGRLLTAALALAIFASVFLGVRALRSSGTDQPAPTQYDERTKAAFLAACVEGAGPGSEPVCGCAYERLVASVPFREYLALEDQVRRRGPAATAGGRGTPPGSSPSGTVPPPVVPDALETILVDCIAYNRQLGTPPGTADLPGVPGSHPPGTAAPGTIALVPG